MENTTVFAMSGFQYIIMAVVVTKGYPHKKPLYYNGESSEMSKDDDLGLEGWLFIVVRLIKYSITSEADL